MASHQSMRWQDRAPRVLTTKTTNSTRRTKEQTTADFYHHAMERFSCDTIKLHALLLVMFLLYWLGVIVPVLMALISQVEMLGKPRRFLGLGNSSPYVLKEPCSFIF